jgi:hypothetical protein
MAIAVAFHLETTPSLHGRRVLALFTVFILVDYPFHAIIKGVLEAVVDGELI